MVNVNLKYAVTDLKSTSTAIATAHQALHQKTGLGSEFTGWLDYPVNFDKKEYQEVKEIAKKLIPLIDVFVVCGIGGSYLGARMAIEALNGLYPNKGPQIIYMGNTFSQDATSQLLDYLKDKRFAVNVISKSGTTAETAIAFRLLRTLLEKRHGEKAREYIIATTDKNRGVLKKIADLQKYPTFTIADDIGGRYSVLTSVGLLPMAIAGIDIDALLAGAKASHQAYLEENIEKNQCYQYAATRINLEKEKMIEVLISYEPQLQMFGEWYKQLYGESEGKQGKGLFPASMTFSTDLHSLGQYIQDGKKILFETIIDIKNPMSNLTIDWRNNDDDGLNYLANKSLDFVNRQAMLGTLQAHTGEGQVPAIIIEVDKLDAFHLGWLIYFFEKACAISGYLSGVNPFVQEGVEVYKRNMFKLLKK